MANGSLNPFYDFLLAFVSLLFVFFSTGLGCSGPRSMDSTVMTRRDKEKVFQSFAVYLLALFSPLSGLAASSGLSKGHCYVYCKTEYW